MRTDDNIIPLYKHPIFFKALCVCVCVNSEYFLFVFCYDCEWQWNILLNYNVCTPVIMHPYIKNTTEINTIYMSQFTELCFIL